MYDELLLCLLYIVANIIYLRRQPSFVVQRRSCESLLLITISVLSIGFGETAHHLQVMAYRGGGVG